MKKNKLFKYLFGSLAGVVLAGAVIGGVVSCSNGNSSTSPTQSQPTSTSTSFAPSYQLVSGPNNSAIAYKDPTPSMSLVATNKISDYSTLISEPNNVIISVLGQREAVINVANANSNNIPNITLNLNPNSTLYQKILNHTNNATDLAQLNNLITLTTTKGSNLKMNVGNFAPHFTSSETFSLSDFETSWAWGGANVISKVGKGSNGLYGQIQTQTLWNDLHPTTKDRTAMFSEINNIYWNNNSNPTPFNLTIDLLPFIKYSQVHPTLTFNTTPTVHKQVVEISATSWELKGLPSAYSSTKPSQIIDVHSIWYANTVYSALGNGTSLVLPYDAQTKTISSVPYMYFDKNGMIVVGTTAPGSI